MSSDKKYPIDYLLDAGVEKYLLLVGEKLDGPGYRGNEPLYRSSVFKNTILVPINYNSRSKVTLNYSASSPSLNESASAVISELTEFERTLFGLYVIK